MRPLSQRWWVSWRSPDGIGSLALTGGIALVLVSIAASQILLMTAIVAALWSWWRHGRRSTRPIYPAVWPLLFFMGWTVLTVLHSHDVARGMLETRKFFLYSILLLVPLICRNQRDPVRIYHVLFAISAVAASAGLIQFVTNPNLDLSHRISGFMSHWMTYSGLLMLVLVALSAHAVCQRDRGDWWVIPLGLMLAAGIYLSETRNAWLGSVAGITTILLLKRPRAVIIVVTILLGLYFASPASIRQRLRSGWDQNDPETRGRIELLQTSLRLIRHNPWFGVGPKNVNREALRYRGSDAFPNWLYQHMHNNILQIAAERGIPGLLLWFWLMLRLVWDDFRVFRAARSRPGTDDGAQVALAVSTGALGAWVALLVAGMFEYNFGDSEVLTLFLFLMAAPYVFLSNSRATAGRATLQRNEFSRQ